MGEMGEMIELGDQGLQEEEGETLVIEDHLQGTLVVMMIVHPGDLQDALLIVTFGDVEEEEDRTDLHPEEVETWVSAAPPLLAVTNLDLKMTDPRIGVRVHLVGKTGDLLQEMRGQERDQLVNQMTAGRKSSVSPLLTKRDFNWGEFLKIFW